MERGGRFLFGFGLADGETDFDFAVKHSFMGATITDMTAFLPGDPSPSSVIDDLFAEGDA